MRNKSIGFREFRTVPFIKQVYGANMRNMTIVAVPLFILWVELFVYYIRTGSEGAMFAVFTVISIPFCIACLIFHATPHLHPVYRQIAKYYGKAKEEIEAGEAEINMSFVEQTLTFKYNKNYFSDTWFVRRNFLFSDLRPLPTPEELDEALEEKRRKREELKAKFTKNAEKSDK